MRNHRLFGVVIAVLLGTSFLHQPPSSPHHDHQQIAGTHLGGTGIELTSAALPAGRETDTPRPGRGITRRPAAAGCGGPTARRHPPGVDPTSRAALARASMADGDGLHIGLLRPAGTRYVKMLDRLDGVPAAPTHPPPPPPLRS